MFWSSIEDGNQESSRDVVSVRKGIENVDVVIRGRKLMMTNGEADKETTTMKRKRKSGKSVDDDGLVAFTADYWRAKPKHHPPRNN
ncbi:hypothetical protein YC2023_025111 [Brassica napus]|uniref:Uncharacterized protein n=1 Tax=Brassica campestris TaxID=3711 RepID=M4ECL6_BRACM